MEFKVAGGVIHYPKFKYDKYQEGNKDYKIAILTSFLIKALYLKIIWPFMTFKLVGQYAYD